MSTYTFDPRQKATYVGMLVSRDTAPDGTEILTVKIGPNKHEVGHYAAELAIVFKDGTVYAKR